MVWHGPLVSLALQSGFRLAALGTTCSVCLGSENATATTSGHIWSSSLSNEGARRIELSFLFFFSQNHLSVCVFDSPELQEPHTGLKVGSMRKEH